MSIDRMTGIPGHQGYAVQTDECVGIAKASRLAACSCGWVADDIRAFAVFAFRDHLRQVQS